MTKQKRPAEVGATAVGGGGVAILLGAIRQMWPDLLWPVEGDAAIVAFVAFVTGPLWAWLKKIRATGFLAYLIMFALPLGAAAGCQILPDGRIIPDKEGWAIILDIYKEYKQLEDNEDQAEAELEAQHRARVNRLSTAAWFAVDYYTQPRDTQISYLDTFLATGVWYHNRYEIDIAEDLRLLFDKPDVPETDEFELFVTLLDRFIERAPAQ